MPAEDPAAAPSPHPPETAADRPPSVGPGLPRQTFRPQELFSVLGVVDSGVRHGHSLLAMHRGYLVVVGSRDGGRGDGNDRDLASAVAFSPRGDYAFVATQGTNTVEVLDPYDGRLLSSILNTGLAPQGLVLSRNGERLYVHNFLSRSLAPDRRQRAAGA